jgi:hypothetical protein
LGGVICLALFSSCKKEKEPTLDGKWNYARKVQKTYTASGTIISENSAGGAASDYYEFRPGGTAAGNLAGALITSINNQNDTFIYVVVTPDTIGIVTSLLEPDTYTFDTKTEKNITLVRTKPFPLAGDGVYEKTYINMRK